MNVILGDGLLATELIGKTGWQYVSRKKDGLDFNDLSNLNSLIPKETNQIINLVANTDTYSSDIKLMFDINYTAVTKLVAYCNLNKIKLIHFSTDYVYENSIENASETDKTGPTTPYAMSKALADEYIMMYSNDYLICRGSHKLEPFTYDYAWNDVYGNFDYVDTITDIFEQLINKNASGLYNIGTPRKNMFELASITNERVKPAAAPDHFPKNLTMNLDKMNDFLENNQEDVETI